MLDVAIRQAFSVRSGLSTGRFLTTPLQMTSFDEGLRIRYANTEARVRSGVGHDAAELEGQTASADQGHRERDFEADGGKVGAASPSSRATVSTSSRSTVSTASRSPTSPAVILPPWVGPGPPFWGLWFHAFCRVWCLILEPSLASPGMVFLAKQRRMLFKEHSVGRYRPVDVTRIIVDPIKRANVAEIKSSLYVFARLLDQVHLRGRLQRCWDYFF